ncbi:MAG: FHA domain-containing protein, partial [Candidatus Bathyarchaeia archaeon]
QTVTVQGRTGYIIREESTSTTTVYTLRDDYGDEIRIRSSRPQNLHMGITYRVKGTVVKEGKRFYLIELERKQLGGITAPPIPTVQEKPWWQENWIPLTIGSVFFLLAILLLVIYSIKQRKAIQAAMDSQRQQAEELRQQIAQLQQAQQQPLPQGQPISPPPIPFTEKPTDWVSPEIFAPPKKVTEEMWGTLEIISGPDQGKRFPLGGRRIVLGRTEGDIRFPNDSTVSSNHAEIILTADGRILFIDHSRNGSKVNDQIVHYSQVELKSGDTIDIGLTVLRFTGRAPSPMPTAPQPQMPTELPLSQKPTELGVPPLQDIAHAPTGQFLGAELEVIRGPDKGKRFPLVKTVTTIGRLEDRDIQLTDITVSRKHCILEFRGGKFILRNESTQGTRVNGELVQERELKNGDEIEMGGTVVKFITVKSPSE